MKGTEYFLTLLFGVLAGFCLMGAISNAPDTANRKASNAITECERSLPRDQICEPIITAVPVKKKKE